MMPFRILDTIFGSDSGSHDGKQLVCNLKN